MFSSSLKDCYTYGMARLRNVKRECRRGHTYETSADGPGLCWCGARVALEAVPLLPKEVVDSLSPGVKGLVIWLNEQGFNTCDSGDGGRSRHGKGSSLPYPMVAILSTPERLIEDARRLRRSLGGRGVPFSQSASQPDGSPQNPDTRPVIQASFDPEDNSCLVVLYNVLSKDALL